MATIKDCFHSRFEPGRLIEADFSQLEVIYLAHITQDKQLIDDILSGIDLHTVRAAELFMCKEINVTPEQRRTAKAFSFMLQYGSGAKHMAEETGHPVNVAQRFIDNYYARYPEVKKWQDRAIEEVIRNKTTLPAHSPGGYPLHKSVLRSETGRMYTFFDEESPEYLKRKGQHTSFKPTTIKNYPVQGGATGDIVPMVLGKLYRWILDYDLADKCKLIATVHDSIVLDTTWEMVYHIGSEVKRIMEEAPKYYEETFGIQFNLPLKAEIKYGKTWGDMKVMT